MDLAALAGLDGAPGDEFRVIEFIRERVGGDQRTGSNGSLLATFGEGSPETLLMAGVDEPGFVVSAVDPHGYLWLHPLAKTRLGAGLEGYFRGQHVRVSARSGRLLPGVVAAPSMHFASVSRTRRAVGPDALAVDIGASSLGEAAAAGVGVLDRVTLEKRVAWLSDDWLSAPWISSRVGAALLLTLAHRLREGPLRGTVTLAFLTQQNPYNAGLARVLQSAEADRILLIGAEGEAESAVAPVAGTAPGETSHYLGLAEKAGIRLKRKSSHSLHFGPFGSGQPWKPGQDVTVLLPAVRNRATPSESVSATELSRLTELLSLVVGLDGDGASGNPPIHRDRFEEVGGSEQEEPAGGFFERAVRNLVGLPGVSGHEDRVRHRIRQLVPTDVQAASRVDEQGNLIVRLGRGDRVSAAFIAHMDEIGYEVRSVFPDGSVSAELKGGGAREHFAWQPADVHGRYGTLDAVMTTAGRLEFGGLARAEVEQAGIRTGDSVTVPKRYRKLLGSRISGRSLDDRLGCAVLLEVIRRITRRAGRAGGAVEFVFSVEEETGLAGARHYAESSRPGVVYPVDTFVTSDTPFGPGHLALAVLGRGAVLRAVDESGMTPRGGVERVADLARRNGIPLQFGVTAGGNDGSVFMSLETANIPIGFPLRYAHTPVETADMRDVQAVADLVEVLALAAVRGR